MMLGALASTTMPLGSSTVFAQAVDKRLKPKPLAAGQTIGLIAPSSNFMENETIAFAADILSSFGFKVKKGNYIYERNGYLAGQDKERAKDVNNMFADQSVDAIICLRGGYGSPRILPYLDYDVIRANPKVIMGFSDVTALLNAIYVKTGLITFHGPVAGQNFSEYTLEQFKQVLFDGQQGLVAQPPTFEAIEGQAEKDNRITVINEGVARGPLIGGNLSLMVKLVDTPYEPSYENAILFLEDVAEAPYRMDGMFTHLKLSGRLDKLAGIAFGKCTRCSSSGNTLSLEQVLFDHLKPLGIPALRGLMIGHIKDNSTIPLGVIAELDTSNPGLRLTESAVSRS
jgi:muramoyltetrapeptide carboxypeptidase